MFKNYDKSDANFGVKNLLPEGIYVGQIIELKAWETKKGFSIKIKIKEKFFYTGFNYDFDVAKFKLLNECLKVQFDGQIRKENYINKQIGIELKHFEKTSFVDASGEKSEFFNTLEALNLKTGKNFENEFQLDGENYKKISFTKEEIINFEKPQIETESFENEFGFEGDPF